MAPDQLIWNQIGQIHDYLRLIGTQGVTWFIFGFGANAAALWVILANNISLKTKNVPYVLAFFNFTGMLFCLLMPFYYHCAAMNIDSLTRQISLEPATNTSPITAGGSTNAVTEKHATQSLVEHPAFSWVLWSMISWLMAIVLLAVTLLWIVFNRDGYLINRSAK